MSKATFGTLCEALRQQTEKQDTTFRRCIPLEKRIAIVLFTLATTAEYRTVANLFGVSKSSVCLIVKEVCASITGVLSKRFIRIPQGADMYNNMLSFERKWGFPNCAGAIDGCHIPIISPTENHTDYFNRKGWHSILLQAVVDANYCFIDTCIGWPGKVHDARVLANSKFYERGQEGTLFPDEKRNLGGIDVPIVVLGDPAYPLLQWLMKPYPDNERTTEPQKRFNYMLSRNRMVIENAFGRLKGRWRRLQKRVDFDVKDVPALILACCTLHNICEMQGDLFPERWNVTEEDVQMHAADDIDGAEAANNIVLPSAGVIRDAFCRNFSA